MYLLPSSLTAAMLGEMRVLAHRGGRVRTEVFLSILSSCGVNAAQNIPLCERLRLSQANDDGGHDSKKQESRVVGSA